MSPGKPGADAGPANIAVAAVRSAIPAAVTNAVSATAPTPFFATFRDVKMRLPISPQNITVVAFHQASFHDALPMTSLVARGSLADAKREATRKRALRAAQATTTVPTTPPSSGPASTPVTPERDDGVWSGKALSLWRSGRGGRPNTAFDCGARPDTPVFSPIDGTIMEIRSYKLYGKYPDFEIHIKPDAWSDVDLIILHTTDPKVVEGQHVVAGIDQISKVRALASKMSGVQLSEYTAEGGNHCHVQINRISDLTRAWLVGQDPPGLVRKTN